MNDTIRYPLQRLEARLGDAHAKQVAEILRVSARTVFRYRKRGLNDRQADHAAVAAGYHPSEIWPELW